MPREMINRMLNDGDPMPLLDEVSEINRTYRQALSEMKMAKAELREAETTVAIALLSPAANRLMDGRMKYLVGRQMLKAIASNNAHIEAVPVRFAAE